MGEGKFEMIRRATSIFCEDIRYERDGRLSYMGVYPGVVWVPETPYLVPKLCLILRVMASREKPIQTLIGKIHFNDDLLSEATFSSADVPALFEERVSPASEEPADVERVVTTQCLVVFSPLRIPSEGVLRVSAFADDEQLKAEGLMFRVRANERPPAG